MHTHTLQAEDLRKALPQTDVHIEHGISHGFVMSTKDDEKVAKFVCSIPALSRFSGQAAQN